MIAPKPRSKGQGFEQGGSFRNIIEVGSDRKKYRNKLEKSIAYPVLLCSSLFVSNNCDNHLIWQTNDGVAA